MLMQTFSVARSVPPFIMSPSSRASSRTALAMPLTIFAILALKILAKAKNKAHKRLFQKNIQVLVEISDSSSDCLESRSKCDEEV